jgi:hypothetical protein
MPTESRVKAQISFGCITVTVTGFLGLIALIVVIVVVARGGSGTGSGSAQTGPSCAVTGGGGVVAVVTGDHQNPGWFCKSMVQGQGDLAPEGPWRAGGTTSGSPACTATNAGLTAMLYDPANTGDGANDCTILQQDSWQVIFGGQ